MTCFLWTFRDWIGSREDTFRLLVLYSYLKFNVLHCLKIGLWILFSEWEIGNYSWHGSSLNYSLLCNTCRYHILLLLHVIIHAGITITVLIGQLFLLLLLHFCYDLFTSINLHVAYCHCTLCGVSVIYTTKEPTSLYKPKKNSNFKNII